METELEIVTRERREAWDEVKKLEGEVKKYKQALEDIRDGNVPFPQDDWAERDYARDILDGKDPWRGTKDSFRATFNK
jgi:hypothetical protein